MAHQRFIFQGSEERCPLKEDVKVDDGFESLLSESQTSNLTLAQNEQSLFTPIFLIFFYRLSPSIQIMKLIMSLKKMLKHARLLQSLPSRGKES